MCFSRRLRINMPRATTFRLVQETPDEGQQSDSSESRVDASTDEEQLDVPRVAQWIDDDERQDPADPPSEEEDSPFVSLLPVLPIGFGHDA
jgi:hypothetical protein